MASDDSTAVRFEDLLRDRNDSTATRIEALLRHRDQLSTALAAPLTRRGYRYDWVAFVAWCEGIKRTPMPADAETVSLYVTDRLAAGRKTSTVARSLAAVVKRHVQEGHPSPVDDGIRLLLHGARRLREESTRQVLALSVEEIRAMVGHLRTAGTPLAIRNTAILLVGFASALRSANLVALNLAHVEFCEQGALLHIGREKTDQEAKGRLIGLPHGKHPETCAVIALNDWILRRGDFAGPLFIALNGRRNVEKPLDAETVGKVVKETLRAVGVDPTPYGSHSLRAGFITEAGKNGASELQIALQSGHRDMATLRRYLRRRDAFDKNACAWIDL